MLTCKRPYCLPGQASGAVLRPHKKEAYYFAAKTYEGSRPLAGRAYPGNVPRHEQDHGDEHSMGIYDDFMRGLLVHYLSVH
jgi:hypothetical protein